MKICHILSSMSVGGMERVVLELIAAQIGSGDEVYLFCTDVEGQFYKDVQAKEKQCGFCKPSLLVFDFKLIAQLARFLKGNEVELIHAHNHLGLLYGAIGSLVAGIPFLVTMHGQGISYSKRVHWLERVLMKKAKCVVAVSEDAKSTIVAKRLAPADKVEVVQNGLQTRGQKPEARGQTTELRAELGFDDKCFIIGSVGRLESEKNYELLITAFARLNDQLSNFPINQSPQKKLKLLLVGDGSERLKLEKLVADLGLSDKVVFAGVQEDVQSWYGSMDVFCLSSLTEGTPMTLLEAGACSLPSVVTDVGGNAEVVKDGVTGIVVASEDEDAMVGAFEELYGDTDLRKKMGDSARKRIEDEYSIDKMAMMYRAIYQMAVEQVRDSQKATKGSEG